MTPPAPSALTHAQILADTFADERRLAPPVDVEELVREFAEVRDLSFGSELGLDAVLAGLNGLGGEHHQPVLLLNSDVAETRRRFTLAHELGHLLMSWHSGTMECHLNEQPLDDSAPPPAGGGAGAQSAWELERDANQFASRILIPRRFVDGLDHGDPESMLAALEVAGVSAEAAVIGLASQLGPGYVFALYDPFGEVFRVVESPGTFNLGLRKGKALDPSLLYRSMSRSSDTAFHGTQIYWGMVLQTMKLTTDEDNWEEILDELTGRHFPEEERRGPKWKSAQAIASAAHSTFSHDDVGQLAVRIKQRFLKRPDEFLDVVDDPRFDDFVSARANAFATRPSKKSKRAKKATGSGEVS